jgi:hypothetical protein
MNKFINVDDIESNCKECESDIFTLLEQKNKQENITENEIDNLLNVYLESHVNYPLLSLLENKKFNIKHIPYNIQKILFRF